VEDTLPPAAPTPRDARAPLPKPPSGERLVPGDEALPLPGTTPVLAAATPADPAESTTAAPPASTDEGVAKQTKAVRTALRRLGIGTITAPVAVDMSASSAVAPPSACTPIGVFAEAAPSQAGAGLSPRPVVRPHRVDGDPPLVRGPPAPLDSPSAPVAVPAGGSAAPGGISGERDAAVLAAQIVFVLAERGTSVAVDASDHIAPASANAAARAPPVA
jgi:hypothetical protein